MAEITVTIAGVSVVPDRINDEQTDFDSKATIFANEIKALGPDINAFSAEANALRDDVNDWATLAERYATEAQDVEVEAGAFSALHHSAYAQAARDKAEQWADEAKHVEVEAGLYSAKHHALRAEDHKVTAQSSAAAAQSAVGLPALTAPGYVLTVNDEGDGVAFKNGTNVQEFSSSGTWAKPAGAKLVLIELWGAGAGGSGGSTGANAEEGYIGGGGGTYSQHWARADELSSSESITVGAGGAGGAGGGANVFNQGGQGGDTAFGAIAVAFGGWPSGRTRTVFGRYVEDGVEPRSPGDGSLAAYPALLGGPGGGHGNQYNPTPVGMGSDGGGVLRPGGEQGMGALGADGGGAGGNGASVTGWPAGGGGGGGGYNASGAGGNGGNGGIAAGGGGGGRGTTTGGAGGNGGNGYARITSW